VPSGKKHYWWRRWWRKPAAELPPAMIRLETRISGHVFQAEVPLKPDGRFESTFSAELPTARRGWRIARNRVTWGEKSVERCGVVVRPAEDTRCIAIVILPSGDTSGPHGAQRLARSDAAARLTPLLRQLQRGPGNMHAIFYLAAVPPDGVCEAAELALATTTLGWPTGNFLLLPAPKDASATILAGLDRLRWLFAGSLDLRVVNLEPALSDALPMLLDHKSEHASVLGVLGPGDEADTLFAEASPGPGNGATLSIRRQGEHLALRPTRSGLVPRYPVVFCHGMLAMTTLRMRLPEDLNCFSPLREFLRERGYRAMFPQVAPTSGVEARARQLREQILKWTDEPVNIVAHSMGGLDARHLITHLGMAGRVRTLTTIATPHRGTYLVDWFIANFRNRVPLLLAMEAMGMNVDGFRDCQPSVCRSFNATTPNMPDVRYFSYVSSVTSNRVSPFLRRAWNLLSAVEGPNDGMVSMGSARWGECLGVLQADHFAQTPDRIFIRPGEDFDALRFYFRLLEDLARRGF
jgi:triacylglycerol lipase